MMTEQHKGIHAYCNQYYGESILSLSKYSDHKTATCSTCKTANMNTLVTAYFVHASMPPEFITVINESLSDL